MKRFENKVARVTGAANGIGRATAERLASEGVRVVAADLNQPDGLPGAVLAVSLDVRSEPASPCPPTVAGESDPDPEIAWAIP